MIRLRQELSQRRALECIPERRGGENRELFAKQLLGITMWIMFLFPDQTARKQIRMRRKLLAHDRVRKAFP